MDAKSQINTIPGYNGCAPVLCDIAHGHVQDFFKCVFRGKSPFGLRKFLELSIKTFDGIGRVNESSNLRAEVKDGSQPIPIAPPVGCRRGIFFAPFFFQFVQCKERSGFISGLVNLFEITTKH